MRLAAVLCLALVGCGVPVVVKSVPPGRLVCAGREAVVFRDVSIVALEGVTPRAAQTVVVCDGKIAAIGPRADTPAPSQARVVEGRGKFLMPGLIDMHTHLMREEDLTLYLARGVTTVRNMWGTPLHLEWRERIKQGELLGPSIITAGPIIDAEPPIHDGSLGLSSEADADEALVLHRRLGYDFLKVYSRVPAAAFTRLLAGAKRAGFVVAGHVPRPVGLVEAANGGQRTLEHLDAFLEALQRDDSPAKGLWDSASRRKKLDYLDETRLPELARLLQQRHVAVCPTRSVSDQLAPPDELRARLQRPDVRYVPEADRAIWQPTEPDAAELEANARWLALQERVIRALVNGKVQLLVGTDPGNPFVVPGFSLHDELAHLVRLGQPPREVLREATLDAAEVLGRRAELGPIAVGRRADLLLLDADPEEDIGNTRKIAGVMSGGRFHSPDELSRLLGSVVTGLERGATSFGASATWDEGGEPEFLGTFVVRWKGARFGAERIFVGTRQDGRSVIRARSFDQHAGQTLSFELELGAPGIGERLRIESDGAAGRGAIDVTRLDAELELGGRSLPGAVIALKAPLPETTLLGVQRMFASKLILLPRVRLLQVGESFSAKLAEVALGSHATLAESEWTVTRIADGAAERGGQTERRFELAPAHGPKATLTLDGTGAPILYESSVFGATLRYERVQ